MQPSSLSLDHRLAELRQVGADLRAARLAKSVSRVERERPSLRLRDAVRPVSPFGRPISLVAR